MSFYDPWATSSNSQYHVASWSLLPLTASQWAISPFTVCCPVPQAALGFIIRCVFFTASGPAFSHDPFAWIPLLLFFYLVMAHWALEVLLKCHFVQEACVILLQDEVSLGCCWVSWQRVLLLHSTDHQGSYIINWTINCVMTVSLYRVLAGKTEDTLSCLLGQHGTKKWTSHWLCALRQITLTFLRFFTCKIDCSQDSVKTQFT